MHSMLALFFTVSSLPPWNGNALLWCYQESIIYLEVRFVFASNVQLGCTVDAVVVFRLFVRC